LYKAILFDLDGTLLPMDAEQFLKEYLQLLSFHASPFMEQDIFIPRLMDSTYQMINNLEAYKTNKEVFVQAFFADSGLDPKVIMPQFDEFYEKQFPKLASFFPPDPIVPKIIEKALEKRIGVVATNPIFPITAIEERLRWAGVKEKSFFLITSYENMHYCKPQVHYYLEILEMIGVEAKECLMVGNDIEEDLVAKRVGMDTFLIDTYMINKQNSDYKTDYQGNTEDLLKFLIELG